MPSRAFAGVLGEVEREVAGALMGLEHEFRVLYVHRQIDFRTVIHALAIDGQRLDPGDPNAYRCRWGGVITADGAEAEIATPVVTVRPGATRTLTAWAARGRTALEEALPADHTLEGFSTHLNVALGEADGSRAAFGFARAFAAPMMLLLERPGSPGLLIRPRPGRLELGGEFADGERLQAASIFALAAARAAMGDVDLSELELRVQIDAAVELRVQIDAAVERFGLFVGRGAFGADLRAGRETRLRRARRGRITAGEHLQMAWGIARTTVVDDLDAEELARVDAIIASSAPLPSDDDSPGEGPTPQIDLPLPPDVFASRACAGLRAHAVVATWDATVIHISAARGFYATVPRAQTPAFVERFADGSLDQHLQAFAARDAEGSTLREHAQTLQPGLFDALGDPAALLPPERDPDGVTRPVRARAEGSTPTGASPTTGGAAPVPLGWPALATRPGKPGSTVVPTPAQPGGGIPWWATVAAVVGVIAIAAVVATNGDDAPTAQPTPAPSTTTSPSAPQLFTRVATKPSQGGSGADCGPRSLTFRFIELDHPRDLVGLPATIVTTGPGIAGTQTKTFTAGGITLTFQISGQGEWRATMTHIAGQPPIAESTGTTYKISGGVGCEIKSG